MIAWIALIAASIVQESPPFSAHASASRGPAFWADDAASEYRAGLAERQDAARSRPRFRKAAADYEVLAALGHDSALLRRDQAQAYLLAGDLANAIRAYRLGLRKDPNNHDLRSGLSWAREQVQYPVNGTLADVCRPHKRASLFEWLSFRLGVRIALALYVVACMALVRGWITRQRRWWWISAVLVAGISALVVFMWLEMGRELKDRQMALVIVANNGTPLRRGNGEHFPLRLNDPLPAGVEMHRLAERGGWSQVQLASGDVGWIENDQFVAVDPLQD